MKSLLGLAFILGLATCAAGTPQVNIYRKLGEGNAMKTCDANLQSRVETTGATAEEAKAKAEDEIRASVSQRHGCGAYIFNGGAGKKLDGTATFVADYQFCRCQ